MKVTLEKLPASQVSLAIELPSERVKSAYDQAVQKLAREANIPGFRKGKVPRQVLIQRFGSRRLSATVLEDLMTTSLQQAVDQEKIELVGEFQLQPSFEELLDRFKAHESLTFSARADVRPEVTLKQYQGLVVKVEEAKPDFSKVDKLLEEKQREIAALIPVEDRPAIDGDVAVLDFKGQLELPEGEELSEVDKIAQEIVGKEVKDSQVDLIPDRFIPGFVAGVVGMKPGETKELPVQFPDNYAQPELAGKSVVFTITLKDLKARELPELNDDFAQEISEFETFAELRESLEGRHTREAERRLQGNKELALSKELLKQVELDLPATLIDREINALLNETASQLQSQGINVNELFTRENLPLLREQTKPQAITRLKVTLALYKIAELESIDVDPRVVDQNVQVILSQYQGKESVDREALKKVVYEDLLKQEVFLWLEQHGTIELVPEGSLATEEEPEQETLSSSGEASVPIESSTSQETQTVPTTDAELAAPEAAPELVTPEVAAEVEESPGASLDPDLEKAEPSADDASDAEEAEAESIDEESSMGEHESDPQPAPEGVAEKAPKTKQLKGRRSVKAKQQAAEAEAEIETEESEG